MRTVVLIGTDDGARSLEIEWPGEATEAYDAITTARDREEDLRVVMPDGRIAILMRPALDRVLGIIEVDTAPGGVMPPPTQGRILVPQLVPK